MRSYKLVLFTGMIPCSLIMPAMPVYAAETLVVTAEPLTQSLDDVTPAAEQQATVGNLGKQKLINVPWSVQTLSDSLTRQVQASSVKISTVICPPSRATAYVRKPAVCRAAWSRTA